MSWDDDDFNPITPFGAQPGIAVQEDTVPSNWDDEEEEEVDWEAKAAPVVVRAPGEKAAKLAAKNAAKEKARQEKERIKAEESRVLSAAERAEAAEKADYELLEEAFLGETSAPSEVAAVPKAKKTLETKADFEQYATEIAETARVIDAKFYYKDFVKTLIKELLVDMRSTDIKEINTALTVLMNEKMKKEKGKKGRSKKKIDKREIKQADDDMDGDMVKGEFSRYEDDFADFM
mmetsp:Transcript_5758/g.6254  ORF Transcript_5758/g.6254 Transcript_5758/m.6254 type:complete len:234 (+) Transcript_5758:91-792(+)